MKPKDLLALGKDKDEALLRLSPSTLRSFDYASHAVGFAQDDTGIFIVLRRKEKKGLLTHTHPAW